MKKGFITILLAFAISWLTSCEKEVFDVSPTMEAYYLESVQLPKVPLDSVAAFKTKFNNFVATYPEAKEHRRYPKIIKNIKAASLRITITCNVEWAGDTLIHF